MSAALVVRESAFPVAETVERLTAALARRGVTVFATIDHADGAHRAGLTLADEVLLVFGNPAVGTALLQADARTGLDLPLRLLVWDDGGTTRTAFHDPHDLAADYDLTGHEQVLGGLRGLLDALTAEVAEGAAVPVPPAG